jgi:2-polyprenyl-3-methyl-5-hydroxy-6-metoxy-1,4-benzoquinol methylase
MTSSDQHSHERCPYCNGVSLAIFASSDWNQGTSRERFRYRKCRACQLTFISRIPSNLARFYVNEQYDIPKNLSGFQSRAESQMWKVDILKSLAAEGSLFEVGPATGEFAYVARRAGFRPKLAEADERCCKFLRDVLKFDVVQTTNPATCLATEDRYDAICIWQAIEHIPEFWNLMDRAVDSLAPRGVLVVSTPNPESVQAKILGKYWPHIDAPRHLYLIPQSWFRSFAQNRYLTIATNTTRDVGSIGLNYYGWYLAVRNFTGCKLPDRWYHSTAQRITSLFRRREELEGGGSSYTIAFRKN